MELHTIGVDLGKTWFHRKRCSHAQLLKYTANLRVQRIGMEAGSGSHFLARALRLQGHDARLIPAQYVKPYVNTNQNDYIDAEAVGRPTMRFVPIKSDDQLDMQSLHRVRALGEAPHGGHPLDSWMVAEAWHHPAEGSALSGCGIARDSGRRGGEAVGSLTLASGANEVGTGSIGPTPGGGRYADSADRAGQRSLSASDAIPGIGPRTATARIAAIGKGAAFRKGRELASWIGLVPRGHSTGGNQKLLGISTRGNCYLPTLFVHGARAVLQVREKQSPGLKAWLAQLTSRAHFNVAVAALANQLARMAWAVLPQGNSISLRSWPALQPDSRYLGIL